MPKPKAKNKVLKPGDAAKLKKAFLDVLSEQKQLDAKIKKLDQVITNTSIKHS